MTDGVLPAVQAWLDGLELAGADLVRARLAVALAGALDDVDAASYVKPRLASELRAVIAELDGHGGAELDVAALLRRVAS